MLKKTKPNQNSTRCFPRGQCYFDWNYQRSDVTWEVSPARLVLPIVLSIIILKKKTRAVLQGDPQEDGISEVKSCVTYSIK